MSSTHRMSPSETGCYGWAEEFHRVYQHATQQYAAGRRTPRTLLRPREIQLLARIGCSAQELYDFVEDGRNGGEPSFATCLLITAVRRDYFLQVMRGRPSRRRIRMEDLPAKESAVGGLAWLPRIMEKARAKLRGEMPDDLMYGCGGDRDFLKRVHVHPADFLRAVWQAGDDDGQIIRFVKAHACQS